MSLDFCCDIQMVGSERIWRKEHDSMDLSCLVSTVQGAAGGLIVRGIFQNYDFVFCGKQSYL